MKQINFQLVSTDNNIAGMLIEQLEKSKIQKHCKALGLFNLMAKRVIVKETFKCACSVGCRKPSSRDNLSGRPERHLWCEVSRVTKNKQQMCVVFNKQFFSYFNLIITTLILRNLKLIFFFVGTSYQV